MLERRFSEEAWCGNLKGGKGGLTIVQRPSVAPVVETGRELEGIETCGYVGDDPENEPKGRPWLSDDHGHVFASQTQGVHAHEVDHPVNHKGAFAVRIWIVADGRIGDGGVVEWNHESEGDERICERHEEIGQYGRAETPEY